MPWQAVRNALKFVGMKRLTASENVFAKNDMTTANSSKKDRERKETMRFIINKEQAALLADALDILQPDEEDQAAFAERLSAELRGAVQASEGTSDDAVIGELVSSKSIEGLAEALKEAHGGMWGEHPEFPVDDWLYEVDNGDTRLGYWVWVAVRKADG